MKLSRRYMLAIVGGGTILAAGGAAGGFLATRRPVSALAPWEAAGGYGDPRRDALSWAILAPNPHNRQPWLVDLGTPDTVILHRDLARNLPETDPFARQLTIGLGCFLELMTLAAGAQGHAVDLDLFPEGEYGPVAIARFRPGGVRDPLFAHALDRRSCKEPFDDRPVSEGDAAALGGLADLVTDPARVADLRALTWAAWQMEAMTPRTMQESVDLMRFGRAEIEASPDGIDLGGPMLETLMLAGMLTRAGQSDPASQGFRQGVRLYEAMLHADAGLRGC